MFLLNIRTSFLDAIIIMIMIMIVIIMLTMIVIDCEQSLFSSNIRGKESKTSKRASVTVSVNVWERQCREPLVAWALGDE